MKKWIGLALVAAALYACNKKTDIPEYPYCWSIFDNTGYFVDTTCDKTESEIKVLAGNGGYEKLGESRFCWRIRQQNGFYLYLTGVSETLLHTLYERNLGATESKEVNCDEYQTWFNRKEALVGGTLVRYETPLQGFLPSDNPTDGKKILLYTSGDTTWQRHYSTDPWF